MNRDKLRRILAFIIAMIMLTGILASTTFDEEVEDLLLLIKESNQTAEEKRELAKSILKEIENIDKEISEINDKIRVYNEDLTETRILLKAAQEELDQAVADRARYQKLLEERLAVMYMYGDVGYLEILFGSESLTDLITRINMVRSIAKYDDEIKDTLVEIEEKIEKKRDEIAAKEAKIEDLISSLEAENKKLEKKKASKNVLYQEARSDAAMYDALTQTLQEDLQALYKEAGGDYTSTSMGNDIYNLLWPTPGYRYITDEYGMRWHPIHGGNRMHYGLDIGAPTNAKIVAPGNGYVSYAQYHWSFGNCIKLEIGTYNGDSYQLLFAHANKLLVKEGDFVNRGDVIAYVGSTGDSNGPHLHLELRKNGNRIDPGTLFDY